MRNAALIFAIIFLVFFPAISGEFLNYDDDMNFVDNPNYRGLNFHTVSWMFSTFHMGHYQPVSWLTLGWDFEIGRIFFGNGMDAAVYHFTNILIHAMNTFIFFLILLRIFNRVFPDSKNQQIRSLAALGGALWFGINPMRVESVAWITERRDLVSGFFFLLTIWMYLRIHSGPETSPKRRITMHAFFLLGLLSKVIVMMTPLVMLALDFYPLNRFAARKKTPLARQIQTLVWEKRWMLLLSFIFGLAATYFDSRHQWLVSWDVHPMPARIAQMAYGLLFYFAASWAPWRLIPIYEMRFPLDVSNPRFVLSLIAVAILIAAILKFRKPHPALVSASVIYFVMLLPVSGIVQNGQQIVATRYSYLSMLGWGAVAAGYAACYLIRKPGPALAARIIPGAALIILASNAFLTWNYAKIWKTSESLWQYTANLSDSSIANNNYARVLLQQKKFPEAKPYLEKALKTQPSNAMAHFNLGIVLEKEGRLDEALAEYRSAMDMKIDKPETYYNAGNLYLSRNELDSARSCYAKSLELNPSYAEARINLAVCLSKQNKIDEAILEYRKALKSKPELYNGHYNLALLLYSKGDLESARQALRESLKIKPDYEKARQLLEQWNSNPGVSAAP